MTHQPAGTYHPPDASAFAANLDQRARRLEQRTQPGPYVPRFCLTATNSAAVLPAEDRFTARWFPWRGAVHLEYITVFAELVVGATTVSLFRGDDELSSIDLVDGITRIGLDETWTPADAVHLSITGQVSYVLVQMWFRGEGGGGLVFSVPGSGIEA